MSRSVNSRLVPGATTRLRWTWRIRPVCCFTMQRDKMSILFFNSDIQRWTFWRQKRRLARENNFWRFRHPLTPQEENGPQDYPQLFHFPACVLHFEVDIQSRSFQILSKLTQRNQHVKHGKFLPRNLFFCPPGLAKPHCLFSDLINMDSYKINGEWEIYSTLVKRNEFFYDCCPDERFANVAFILYMRRRHTFYVLNVILPSIMTSVLLLSVFFCTPGQKVTNVHIQFIYLHCWQSYCGCMNFICNQWGSSIKCSLSRFK